MSNVSRSKLFSPMRSVYFNHVVYFYIFTATSNLFLPILNIFMHIPSYFHVYLYLYLLRFYLYLPRFTYFYLYLLRFYLYLPRFTYFYHKSVVFYHSLPQKCDILLQNKCQKTWHFYISAQNARFLALIWR